MIAGIRFKSLRRKVFTAFLLSTLLALLVCGAALFVYDLHAYRDKSATDLLVEAKLLGNTSVAALQFDDPASAAQNMGFLRARPNIRAAAVYTSRGSLFASYVRDDVPRSEVPGAPDAAGTSIHGDTVSVFHQIALNGERVGSIYLVEDLNMYDRIWSYMAIVFGVIVLSMAAAGGLSIWLQKRITGPIIEIADLARDVVERRDYAVRAKRTTQDEIGMLVDAFNEMLSEIQRRTGALISSNAEIQRLNEELERRVAERTAQLEESNLQLKGANLAKSNFLSMMSHEIRTPMNGVLGMLELLSLSELGAQQRGTLNIVRESGRSLLRIIDDILDFSKIEAGRLEVRPEVASVARIVESVAGVYSGNASSKALVLRSYCDPRISAAVLVDPLRLQQILNNLVSNAIKFTSEGFVEIKADLVERSAGRDLVRFSVSDTGIGISGESRASLFEPFFQGGQEITRMFGGTGLGLSIGQRLATMMGGSIAVASELGEGTTVTLLLPLPVADPALLPAKRDDLDADGIAEIVLARRQPPSREEARAERTLVLLVDDHPVNRLVLKRQVTVLGYASVEAEDGRDALEKWRSGEFALVITDCNMPNMDGYQLARAIRSEECARAGAPTVIIACTANALKGEAENCFAAGMNDYISKPVQLPRLLEKLEQWLPIGDLRAGAVPTLALPSSDALSPVDREVMRAAAGGDPTLEREILMQFRRFNDEDVARLASAYQARDAAEVATSAHRIKGASRTLGAMSLGAICEGIESAARQGDWDAVEACRAGLDRQLERLDRYIADALEREQAPK